MHRFFEFAKGHRHGHRGGGGRHGFFDRFGGFGGGMRAARMLASGDLQLIVLSLLNEGPRHGYEIIKALEEHSSGVYTPSPGVVYPALTYLEEVGYATAEAEGNKKRYSITEGGKEHLSKNLEIVEEIMEHLARFGRKMARFQNEFADDENVRDDFSADPKGQARKEWRQFKMRFHDLWHEMKDAIREKRDAPMEERERVYKILKDAIEEIRKK